MLNLILKSLVFYRRSSVYQAVIVFILSAIITGSLLTGFSVRQSLKTSANEHLGNADMLISSGFRYFNSDLADKVSIATGENCVRLLETNGYCQNFATGNTALNAKIYAVDPEFFKFQGVDTVLILPGSVAINQNLADHLSIKTGDEIIVHYREVSAVPANAPFAPSEKTGGVKVFKISRILKKNQAGNFSLGISQIVPMNVFMNLSDLISDTDNIQKSNRIILKNAGKFSKFELTQILKKSLSVSDIGFSIRQIPKTGGTEVISDRIFIDQQFIGEVQKAIPSSQPLITYLANSIRRDNKMTPYSFVAALPASTYPEAPEGNDIVINKWLAQDLHAFIKDTLSLSWYSPSSNGKLEEKTGKFLISNIVNTDSIWGDPLLMPEFPGIAGTNSCSDWDAGVAINMKLIRKKDEAYWNSFKGTPKAYISYEKGKEIWGSNFGPATAIRFPGPFTKDEVQQELEGKIDPENSGFTISDIRAEAIKAASESVDFSSLFLSLGFFIILSCVILLALSVSIFFDSLKGQIKTFFALGFREKWIERLFFLQTSLIAFSGALPGAFAGGLINKLIIVALNSVWSGAVQTNSLDPHFSLISLIIGFSTTIIICLILLGIKSRQFIKNLNKKESGIYKKHSKRRNIIFLFCSLFVSLILIIMSFVLGEYSTSFSFAGGISVFFTFILGTRLFFIGGFSRRPDKITDRNIFSKLYYSFYPSHAITPVIFIAAGIFAVFITGVNRLTISDKMKEPSGGTGGFLLWCESAVPVKENLNILSGRIEFGLDEDSLKELSFVQAKRSAGNDASCLNLNHITLPPLLGLDPSIFISKGSFSFATKDKELKGINPWLVINKPAMANTVYGIADQTVLEWGMKMAVGDTIKLKSESGQPLNVVVAAGLKSSIFQGFVIIGADNFNEFYPSVPGSSVFLADGNPGLVKKYSSVMKERFSNYGFSVMPAIDRLASFFEVTNTYLAVFTILSAFGLILGVIGLGFILLRNYNHRKREFAAMLATGYSNGTLRNMIFKEQMNILAAGILTGLISAIIATMSSLKTGSEIPWAFLAIMIISVFLTGLIALSISVRAIKSDSLISSLRKE